MLKLSHDGIAEDADLVSVWDRLAQSFKRTNLRPMFVFPAKVDIDPDCGWDADCGEVVS